MALLETKNLTRAFGGLVAVDAVGLSLSKGQILGLIGPNGAGKTTTFNMIAGLLPPSSGQIIFKGEDITGFKPHQIARKGLARTFQLTSVFPDLSVLDNVQVALHDKSGVGFLRTIVENGEVRKKNRELTERAIELLDLVGLSREVNHRAGSLPGGHQKLLSIVLALAVEPELLLLDEPVRGLNAEEIARLMEIIKIVRSKNQLGIMLVEHNVRVIMGQCDHVVVLNFGKKIAEGTPAEIANNKDVIEAYLGGGR